MDPITVEEIHVFTLWVVLSVKIGIIAIRIPPSSPEVLRAVIVSPSVIVAVVCTEHVSIVVVTN